MTFELKLNNFIIYYGKLKIKLAILLNFFFIFCKKISFKKLHLNGHLFSTTFLCSHYLVFF